MIDKQIIQEKISVLQEELGLLGIIDEEFGIILGEAIKQIHFYNELTKILDGEVKSKNEDVVNGENFRPVRLKSDERRNIISHSALLV